MVRFLNDFVARLDANSDGVYLLPSFAYATACISTETKICIETGRLYRRQRLSSYLTARFDHVWGLPEHACSGSGHDRALPYLLHLYAVPLVML